MGRLKIPKSKTDLFSDFPVDSPTSLLCFLHYSLLPPLSLSIRVQSQLTYHRLVKPSRLAISKPAGRAHGESDIIGEQTTEGVHSVR